MAATRRSTPDAAQAPPPTAAPPSVASRQTTNHPELKIGPHVGGIGVAVWASTADTPEGPRRYRSITISPRRDRDRETGDWHDATGFFRGDIPTLLLALQEVQAYIIKNPLRSHDAEGEGSAPY